MSLYQESHGLIFDLWISVVGLATLISPYIRTYGEIQVFLSLHKILVTYMQRLNRFLHQRKGQGKSPARRSGTSHIHVIKLSANCTEVSAVRVGTPPSWRSSTWSDSTTSYLINSAGRLLPAHRWTTTWIYNYLGHKYCSPPHTQNKCSNLGKVKSSRRLSIQVSCMTKNVPWVLDQISCFCLNLKFLNERYILWILWYLLYT